MNETTRLKVLAAVKMLAWIAVVIITDAMIRSGLPDLFYQHGSPEAEMNNWQPIDQMTSMENVLTLSIGGALIGIIVDEIRGHVLEVSRYLRTAVQDGGRSVTRAPSSARKEPSTRYLGRGRYVRVPITETPPGQAPALPNLVLSPKLSIRQAAPPQCAGLRPVTPLS